MPGFKGNQEWLIRANYPKGWLWQGSPYIAPEVVLPVGQPLIVVAPQRQSTIAAVLFSTTVPPAPLADYVSPQVIVAPQQRVTPGTALTASMQYVAPYMGASPARPLVVSRQLSGWKPTIPAVLSAGIAIVPEPSDLLRSPLIIPAEPPPPTSPPTLHGGLTITQELPPRQQLIVPPPPRIISSPALMRGRTGEEIIIPRGQLIVPAQELPKTRPSIFRQFPSIGIAAPSTFWVPRGWVPEGWVPLPPAPEQFISFGQTLIAPAAKRQPTTPTPSLWARSIPAPLVWPSRPLIAPAPEQPKSAAPNTLKWHTPPLEIVSLPLAQPLLVPAQRAEQTKPSTLRAFIPPTAVVPTGQPLIVPGQPSPALAEQELKWFTPEAIIPPSGQVLVVLPEQPSDYAQGRSTHSRTIRFPMPSRPPINAQLIVRAPARITYQQPFAITGGEAVTVPPFVEAQISFGLLAYESEAAFVFSRESDSTI